MDSKLLSKIQSIKTLRDRAGTDGERDAAQGKLTLILAKHKLTEQDIPEPGFSARGPQPSYNSSRRPGKSQDARKFEEDLWQTMRDFEDAVRNAGRPHQPQPNQQRRTKKQTEKEYGAREVSRPQQRFETALGKQVSHTVWYRYIKRAQISAQRAHQPQNKAAFSRAFYEAAALSIRKRLNPGAFFTPKQKSTNPEGTKAGKDFGETIDLALFNETP